MTAEILTVKNVKITVFWDVTLCSVVGTNVSEEPAASIFRVEEDRSSRFLRNVDIRQTM
jgi:hypothetical protein